MNQTGVDRDLLRCYQLKTTVGFATLLWFVAFFLPWGSFWIKISLSAASLAALSLYFQPDGRQFAVDGKTVLIGLVSAAILYLIFWAGKAASTALFSFAGQQIEAVYGKGEGASRWIIALLLFFVTGPSEEIYWRGFLQRNLMERFGPWRGWLITTGIYAGVHIWSFNFMLIGAAAVAGAFWGALYWRLGRLEAVIISHSLWSTFIFAVLPVP